jgi:hypothetical protein
VSAREGFTCACTVMSHLFVSPVRHTSSVRVFVSPVFGIPFVSLLTEAETFKIRSLNQNATIKISLKNI